MARLEIFSFMAALVCLGLSAILAVIVLVAGKVAKTSGESNASSNRYPKTGYLAITTGIAGLVSLTLSMVSRAVLTGHGPFSNIYEFSLAFSWGIVVMGFFFERRYRAPVIRAIGVLMALGLLLFANTIPSQAVPLVPALQQSFLLTTHVAAAVIAYGAFAVGFGAAILYLLQERCKASWLPGLEALDEMSYYTVVIGFPFLTLVIVLGAIWADVAWGRYWGWDPKETAALVTWLLYAGYLHARVMRGWRGRKAAILLIVGFFAILLTFFGNYIFQGLHSYQ